jgi:hypothetical protein
MADEEQFASPLAALRVLEVSLDGLRDLLDELRASNTARTADMLAQIDRRFGQSIDKADSSVAALDRLTDQRFIVGDKALTAAMIAADKAVQAALSAAKEAVDKAEVATEKRFDEIKEKFLTVNEFRGQLSDQALLFIPRAEAEIRFAGLEKAIDEHTRYIDRSGGSVSSMADQNTRRTANLAVVMAGISGFGFLLYLVIAIATHGKF